MMTSTWRRNAALVVPLLLVNTAAMYGQQGWAYDHLGHDRAIAIMFATAVESIAIYLAVEAHAALMAGDASIRLRFGSYLVGVGVGLLNYAHFADPAYAPNPLALTFGLLSSISPWLWAIRSRSLNRDRLRELGQIDPRAVRFSLLRWALFPIRTASATRAAVWAGIVQPAEAVALADARRAARKAPPVDAGTEPTPAAVEVPAPRKPAVPRKSLKTAAKVARTAAKMPDAKPTQVAAKLGVSETTARRYMPTAEPVSAPPINGHAVAAIDA